MPSANAIANPKSSSSEPLRIAAMRVCQPTKRANASTISAMVAIQAIDRPTDCGTIDVSRSVYTTKCAKSPHDTRGSPDFPHIPKRSATADRNDAASANLRASALRTRSFQFLSIPNSTSIKIQANTRLRGKLFIAPQAWRRKNIEKLPVFWSNCLRLLGGDKKRSALILHEENKEPRGFRLTGVATYDVYVLWALVEGLAWDEGHFFAASDLHHN